MAKYVPMELLKSLSGKVCAHSDVYFANRGDTQYTGKLCNPRTKAYSTAELARQTLFASAIANAKAILNATSSDADQSNYTKLQAYQAQHNALPAPRGALFNFIMKKEYAVLKAAQA